MAGSIIARTKPEGGVEDESQEGMEDPGMMAAAEDMIQAFHSKDAKALAEAFEAAFAICESKPHEEGPEEMGEEA
jgi:hypothetical protein